MKKIVIAFKESYSDFEQCPAEILKNENPDELHIFEMEEAYSIQEYKINVNDPVFDDAVSAGKIKMHCVHLAPDTKPADYHLEFPDWDKLASIQPTRIREYTPNKVFLSQNHMIGYHRDYLVESLYNKDLLKHGYVSYKQVQFEKHADAISIQYKKDKNRTKIKRKWKNSHELYDFFPFDQESHIKEFVYDYFDNPPPPLDYWEKSLFNIVTESWYKPRARNTDLISEKTYSCLYHAQPFIIVGCAHMHKFLREQGYEDYPCFDYSFDSYKSIEERIDCVVQQVEKLCNLPSDQLEKIYHEIAPIAKRNQQRFLEDVKSIELPSILNDNDAVIYPRAKVLKDFMENTKNYAKNKNL